MGNHDYVFTSLGQKSMFYYICDIAIEITPDICLFLYTLVSFYLLKRNKNIRRGSSL